MEKKAVDILSAILRFNFEDDYTFTADSGLNIAVGFTAYDDETEPTLDPSIGEVQFRRVAWSKTDFSNTIIPSHPCSDEELGLSEEPSHKYMKPRKDSYAFV